MKRIISIILISMFSVCLLASCGVKDAASDNTASDSAVDGGKAQTLSTDDKGRYKLTFAQSINFATIESLDGKTVVITGYMATLSPISGKYMYLMNLPYQSCPYCVPNTSQLSNTIAVYAPEGKTFEFTDSPIVVTGTVETGEFSDDYGYTYNYRITDATYSVADSSAASEKLTLWQKISDEGLSADVYAMFDYVSFMCNWPTYTAKFDGVNDVYLYPADVDYFKKNQFSTESSDTYFDNLIKRAENIDKEKLSELCVIIDDAEKLTAKAQKQLDDANYSYDSASDRYTLTYAEELSNDVQQLYQRYANWLEMFSLSSN